MALKIEDFPNTPEPPQKDDRIHSLQTEVAYLRKELDEEKSLNAELSNRVAKITSEIDVITSVLRRCCDLATGTEQKVRMWPFVPTK
jgi:uncharacterized small protein (DUF1192 family)